MASGRVVAHEEAKQVLRTLAQEAKVAALERQELESLRAKSTDLETALQAAKVTIGEEESRKARWKREIEDLLESRRWLKKQVRRLKAKLPAEGEGEGGDEGEDREQDESTVET